MGIREADVELLTGYYPGLRVIARQAGPAPVLAVEASITGIIGMHSTGKRDYQLIIETVDLVAAIPQVWVRSPSDAVIRHVNIWHARESFCCWAGIDLPSFCWSSYADGWTAAPAASRTLGAALEYIRQFVNMENHDSRAR
jgi:hypothetical protein